MLKGVIRPIEYVSLPAPQGYELELRSTDEKGYWRHRGFVEVYGTAEDLVGLLGALRQAASEGTFNTEVGAE